VFHSIFDQEPVILGDEMNRHALTTDLAVRAKIIVDFYPLAGCLET
jgi:hypothetical protein